MLKKSFLVYATAVIAAAVIGVSALAFPAMAAELSNQTLSSNSVTVKGQFEEGATLTVSTALQSEQATTELKERGQIRNEKQIVALYNISVSGEQAAEPVYSVNIATVKLNPLAKNKISVIDPNGAYYAISGFDYNKNTVSFKTDTLGQIIIYQDMTLFYVIIGIISGVAVLIISLKIIEAKRFKAEKDGKNRKKTVREHDRKYHW